MYGVAKMTGRELSGRGIVDYVMHFSRDNSLIFLQSGPLGDSFGTEMAELLRLIFFGLVNS